MKRIRKIKKTRRRVFEQSAGHFAATGGDDVSRMSNNDEESDWVGEERGT